VEAAPLSAEQLAAIDAAYEPFPDFLLWPQSVPRADLWERSRTQLDALKAEQLPDGALDAAVRTAMRAAAFDTGAIEGLYKTDRGLTMTVATQAAAWQATVDERAPDARAYFEAQLEAYELVLDVVTSARPVTETWIRQLHEVLSEPQATYEVQTPVGPQLQALPRGRYKTDSNHVRLQDGSVHPYAPVEATAAEMARLTAQIATSEFLEAHPVTQASYVHYCLVLIHPFSDGNGRVARAVASVYFYKALSVPLVVFVDQRDRYLLALEAADRGDREPFIKLVAEAGRAAAGMVIDSILTALGPSKEDELRKLGALVNAQGGLTHSQLDAVAKRLQDEVTAFIGEAMNTIDLPPGVSTNLVEFGHQRQPVPDGYRVVLSKTIRATGVTFDSAPPAAANVTFGVVVAVSTTDDEAETFTLFDVDDAGVGDRAAQLVLGLSDVYPELTVAAQFRIRTYVERLIALVLAKLVEEARTSLDQSGYSPPEEP
jgi:Fic family protein